MFFETILPTSSLQELNAAADGSSPARRDSLPEHGAVSRGPCTAGRDLEPVYAHFSLPFGSRYGIKQALQRPPALSCLVSPQCRRHYLLGDRPAAGLQTLDLPT